MRATLPPRTTAKKRNKDMFTTLKFYLLFRFAFLSGAKEIQLDSGSSVQFDNFVEHKFHYLEVPNKTETKISEFVDCAMECLNKRAHLAWSYDGERICMSSVIFFRNI